MDWYGGSVSKRREGYNNQHLRSSLRTRLCHGSLGDFLSGFLQRCSPSTWGVLAATLLLLSLFFHIFIYTHSSPVYDHKWDVLSTFLWVSRVLLKQSVSLLPSTPGTRPFMVCWWLATFVLSSSYVSNIIAYITVPDKPRKIKTLAELSTSYHPLYMSNYGSFVPGYLSTSQDPVYQRLATKLSLELLYYEDIRDQVLPNQAAIIEGTAYMDYITSWWPVKDMYYVEEILYPYYMSWAFQKGTPWVFVFNKYLRWMTESGLVERWKTEVVAKFRDIRGSVFVVEGTSSSTQLKPLIVQDLQTAFYILILGLLTSGLVMLTEMFMKR
ncbi:hypothetical protein Pmani_034860 [Petrolisthes manimaculis]|uniref:Ionotropic glutamate receptor C-terminal domain-containing protein n=1 Tax=Petrolisthes manimaculis TaxID=1843537 RepID=A0AAE1NNG9_9EUCA|nr:hypothetical protein Pmani_034860 [Petrolisthes manimaculis]